MPLTSFRRKRAVGWLAVVGTLTALTVAPSVSPSASASTACPWVGSTQPVSTRVSMVLKRMTLAEKVQLVTGASTSGPSAGLIKGIAGLCIPNLVLDDASAGIGNRQTDTTAFPDEIEQAATWDSGLQVAQGRALGLEAVAKGVNEIFGPGVNLTRSPLGGRGFEYAGEDPYLAGQTAASLVRGIQTQPVIATVKHFALNEQETNRTTESSDASERTMAELYLQPFAAAVKAGAGAVMCSYNRVNSTYACQNPTLLKTDLRTRDGFTGFVVSDYGATHSTASSANAGLDMEMPTGTYYGSHLQADVNSGAVKLATLNGMVMHILTSMFRIGLIDHPPKAAQTHATTSYSLAVAKQVAEQGSVLLKNTGVLPIASTVKKIAIFGDAASPDGAQKAIQGYGSAHVPQFAYQGGVSDPETTITDRAEQNGATVTYDDGTGVQSTLDAAAADVAIVFVNDVENEGVDRPDLTAHSGTCSISGENTCTYSSTDQDQLVSQIAAANKNTIVVLQTGGPVLMPWASKVAGIVENWLPGQIDGQAIAPLLFGDVNFMGKLPVTFPTSLTDGPMTTAAQYPGVTSDGVPHVSYSEGLLTGYHWWDSKKTVPAYPFGFGLSYTSFAYSGLQLKPTSSSVGVSFTVRNSGARSGAEISQVYVSAPASAGEPVKWLKGYAKTTLAAGKSATVSLSLDSQAFSVWSTSKHAWVVAPGCWLVRAGGSSRSLPLVAKVARGGGHC